VASAFNQLTNTGLIINKTLNLGLVVDPTQPTATQEITANLNSPVAVASDPITNQFIIINQGNNTAAVYSLGAVRPLQITEVSPQIYNLASTLTSPAVPASQTLMIVGGGFNSSSVARLDGIPLPTNFISGRELTVTVPAAMLSSPRRFALDVLNPGPAVTNGEEFIVTQTVDLRNPGCTNPAPDGIAVDPVNNVAVTSLFGCNSVAVVNLSNGMGTVVSVGESPAGVAVLPNVHLAAVANYASNNVSIVDTVALDVTTTESVGSGPLGVDADQNTGEVAVACSAADTINLFNAITPASESSISADSYPYGVAIDPVANLVASANAVGNDLTVADATLLSSTVTYSGMQQPTGVIYDPIGYQFLVASSLSNQIYLVSSISQQSVAFSVGINPTSIAYNPFSSTLVTTNTESGTMTVVDLLARQIRSVLSVNSGAQFSVAIHPWTNVAAVADAQDNELVFIPLPR
jgi:YVTN family beta-propeller protein